MSSYSEERKAYMREYMRAKRARERDESAYTPRYDDSQVQHTPRYERSQVQHTPRYERSQVDIESNDEEQGFKWYHLLKPVMFIGVLVVIAMVGTRSNNVVATSQV